MLLMELVDFLWVAEFLLFPKPMDAWCKEQIVKGKQALFTLYEVGDYEIRVLESLRRKAVSLFYGSASLVFFAIF